ncbi:response regulator [Labilibaculum sp. K2S]|uniref:response regulator n=1 Tax=Labilibaculum sp. K2S TaxID=3056386 RepID=UPI0025A45E4A|nr:response regulator [Labilibaculum sp. K2S]MDM8161834.1 response regulator [Labilibaculum sp. K2S]
MKILYCDSDKYLLDIIAPVFRKAGHEIIVAENCIIAIDQLRDEQFDVFITGMLMPFHSGLEMIEIIRDNLKLALPIVVVTKVRDSKIRETAFTLGADSYLFKPLNPQLLYEVVEGLICKGAGRSRTAI